MCHQQRQSSNPLGETSCTKCTDSQKAARVVLLHDVKTPGAFILLKSNLSMCDPDESGNSLLSGVSTVYAYFQIECFDPQNPHLTTQLPPLQNCRENDDLLVFHISVASCVQCDDTNQSLLQAVGKL